MKQLYLIGREDWTCNWYDNYRYFIQWLLEAKEQDELDDISDIWLQLIEYDEGKYDIWVWMPWELYAYDIDTEEDILEKLGNWELPYEYVVVYVLDKQFLFSKL